MKVSYYDPYPGIREQTMSGNSSASIQVQTAIKDLLKRGGHQQKDLAKALGVSLPTIKRLLNGCEIGLERLVEIAHFFNLSVFELMDLCRQKKLTAFPFTETQEIFLAKNLLHIVVFRGFLRSHSAATIKTRYNLSAAQLEKILIGLDKVGLLEYWTQEKVKLKAKWPFKWIEGGVLQRTYMPALLKKIFEHSSAAAQSGESFFRPYELALQSSSYEEFRKELVMLMDKYRSISKLELASHDADNLLDITGFLSAGNFTAWDEMLRQ